VNKNTRLFEPGTSLYLVIMLVFAAGTLYLGSYILAAVEGFIVLSLLVYSAVISRKRKRQLQAYIEDITYNTESARNNTLTNFPLPISVFRLDDSKIVWGNEKFFDMCGRQANRTTAGITDLVPGFSAKWLLDGHSQYPGIIEIDGRKYNVKGNIVHSKEDDSNSTFMGVTYWIDVTDYEAVKTEYTDSRPVAGVIVFDNYEELCKNQPDRIKNDLRDNVEEKLMQWGNKLNAAVKRYERDKYFVFFEVRSLEELCRSKFDILETVHDTEDSLGSQATISIGLGVGGNTFEESFQSAVVAAELAISRGGNQAVVKTGSNFDFYGGRSYEIEKRTKVRSRVIANTLAGLICDSTKVYVMGHAFADLDSLGASVGICALADKCGVPAKIVINTEHNSCKKLIADLKADPLYKDRLISGEEAMLSCDGGTLLVVVDTGRPEKTESPDLVETVKRIAVIDHHRVGATFIENAALSVIEPYASSACELVSEILEEICQNESISVIEANSVLAGIILDTKSFAVRTCDRTFDAASWLKKNGADTLEIKKYMQSDFEQTMARIRLIETAQQYRGTAIVVSETEQSRIVAATAADHLLDIAGVDASFVIYKNDAGSYISARAMGAMNVQIIMEKLGGGGNASVAATQLNETDVHEAEEKLRGVIDEYFDNKAE